MSNIQFYFLTDQYYIDFPDANLMRNKEKDALGEHSRPCFFAIEDVKNPTIKWIVPVSSKYAKYKQVAETKEKRFGKCNTIILGEMLGRPAAFLIQNICPSTDEYLIPYTDKNKTPIRIKDNLAKDIIVNAKDVLRLHKRGIKLVFPDINAIYNKLIIMQN